MALIFSRQQHKVQNIENSTRKVLVHQNEKVICFILKICLSTVFHFFTVFLINVVKKRKKVLVLRKLCNKDLYDNMYGTVVQMFIKFQIY